jgi:hypothetical protein
MDVERIQSLMEMDFHDELNLSDDTPLLRQLDFIEAAFGVDCKKSESVSVIMSRLDAMASLAGNADASAETKAASDWASTTLKALQRASPTSLAVTHEAIKRGASLPTLGDCLRQELRIASQFMEGKDFFEGVRALLVDKDGSPVWSPASLEDVSEADVEAYFQPIKGDPDLDIVFPEEVVAQEEETDAAAAGGKSKQAKTLAWLNSDPSSL